MNKLMRSTKNLKTMIANKLMLAFIAITATPAFANVDTSEFLDDAKKNIADGLMIVGLVVGALGFLAVAYYAVAVFSDVQKGKKTWTDFGAVAIVGVVMLIVVFWMLAKMAEGDLFS